MTKQLMAAMVAGCRTELFGSPDLRFGVVSDIHVTTPKDRPFFYAQHEMPNDTVNASWLVKGERWGNGHDDGTSTKFLSKYPNVIAFSGHCHNSLTDEMSIWQGAFTAVNCLCNCGFVFMAPGRENGWSCDDFNRDPPFEMPAIDIFKVNQGLVMEVFMCGKAKGMAGTPRAPDGRRRSMRRSSCPFRRCG